MIDRLRVIAVNNCTKRSRYAVSINTYSGYYLKNSIANRVFRPIGGVVLMDLKRYEEGRCKIIKNLAYKSLMS